MPQLNFFSLAAIAVTAWLSKTAIALFLIAHSGKRRCTLAATAVAVYVFGGGLLWYHHYSLSGDQTSYLIETVSLLRHRSVNTSAVIESGEYREFEPSADKRLLTVDTVPVRGVNGFPARDFGVSLYALPGYILAKLDGARLTVALAAILMAAMVFRLVEKLGVSSGAGVLAWAGTCFSLPVLHYSSMFYPELLGAALIAAGIFLLQGPLTASRGLAMSICVALLPTISARYWTLAAPLALLCFVRLAAARRWKLLPFLVMPAFVLIAAEVWVNKVVYGIAVPNAGYVLVLRGASPAIYNQASPFASNFLKGWVGIWLDKNWGACASAPLFLLALAGIPALWLRSKTLATQFCVLIGPYFVATASTTLWTGGGAALPRYLVPLLPLFALPLAAILDNGFTAVAVMLSAVGALTAIASLTSFDAAYNGLRLAVRCYDSFGFTTAAWLPSVAAPEPLMKTLFLIGVWICAGFVLAVFGWRLQRSRIPQHSVRCSGSVLPQFECESTE
jgi:hypothetical protein